jgi:nucleoside-diphosphate-sugar epimerase
MTKIVITGALGHIGSRLIRELPARFPGAELVLVDDLSSQRYASLFDLPDGARYRFVEADVVTADLAPLLAGADAVLHLAAITNAEASFERKPEVERVNHDGAIRVGELCAAAGVPMVFLSTTSVYGPQSDLVDEDCSESDLKPQSPYADSKLRAERGLEALGRERGLRHVTLRFGTIFGWSVGMRFHTAVNKFVWQATNGKPLTVWRTAMHQKRPYLDLGDAVDALALVVAQRLFDGRVYNVVTVNATVADVVEAVRTAVPTTQVTLVDSAIMNQLSYEVSSKRFQDKGWTPRGDLREAIATTAARLKLGSRA